MPTTAAKMPAHARPAPAEPTGTAEDVYSFLTSFTAGVQRGLDEFGTPLPPDNGDHDGGR
jgi:hypothetical protein